MKIFSKAPPETAGTADAALEDEAALELWGSAKENGAGEEDAPSEVPPRPKLGAATELTGAGPLREKPPLLAPNPANCNGLISHLTHSQPKCARHRNRLQRTVSA